MKQQKYTPFRSLSSSSSFCAFLILHSAIVSLICLQYMFRLWKKSNDNHGMVKSKIMKSIMIIMSYLFKVQREQVECV